MEREPSGFPFLEINNIFFCGAHRMYRQKRGEVGTDREPRVQDSRPEGQKREETGCYLWEHRI